MMIVKISGQEVLIKRNTKSIENAIEERSTAKFVVIDYENIEYRKGQNVEILEDSVLLFSGVIQKPVKKKDPSADIYLHTITCTDWHYLADKKIARGGYNNMLAGDIVKDLITKYLASEGVTAGSIEDGPIVSQAQFNYVPVTNAMDALAEKAGFWWKIDPDKKLHFVNRSTNAAPFTILESDCYGAPSSEVANDKYRNTQYVLGALDVTDPMTESFAGDGENKTFTVGFPIAQVPTVEVSLWDDDSSLPGPWEPQIVGIRGLDEGKQWYWSKGDNTITQDQSLTPLRKDIDKIRITFQGQYPVVAIVKNQSEIDAYQVYEGATGIVEAVESISQDNNAESAFETANQKLDRFGQISRKVKFKTLKPGLEPGQLLQVIFTKRGTNEEMLIESIETTEEDGLIIYSVVAVAGPSMGSWAKLFLNMAQKGQDLIIRENIKENQVIVILEQFSKTWLLSDALNIFRIIRPAVGLKPGFKPMFAYHDRVRYLAWFNGEDELGRKRITKQTGAESTIIVSTTFLGPNDAIVEITHVGWIGGQNASDDIGTGLVVDKQSFSKAKTNLEALQIVKTDTKGW